MLLIRWTPDYIKPSRLRLAAREISLTSLAEHWCFDHSSQVWNLKLLKMHVKTKFYILNTNPLEQALELTDI